MWEEGLSSLGALSPWDLKHVVALYENIHDQYRMGWDSDGPDAYYLAREMDKLARRLRRLYHPVWTPQLARLASELKQMARDIQIGRRRLRFASYPEQRHNRLQLLGSRPFWGGDLA